MTLNYKLWIPSRTLYYYPMLLFNLKYAEQYLAKTSYEHLCDN